MAAVIPQSKAIEARELEPWDFQLLAPVVLLLGLGAVMVYSATINNAAQIRGNGAGILEVHLIHVGLGILAMIAGMMFPYRAWRPLVYPMLLGVVVLLGLVILIGTTAGQARRWIALPGFSLQPAEMAKLAFVVFLAHSVAKKADRVRQFTVAFVPHLLVCSVLIILCLFQPDFGTGIILVTLMFAMLFVAGTPLSYISLFACIGAFLAFEAIANNDMRLGRVMAFIDPWAYRTGRGYQMVNSLIAIGSGGLTGQGIGYGGQTLTGYLPEGHTDFILSVTGEQMGAVGVSVVTLLFGVVLVRGLAIARSARDDFGRFLAFGITLLIGLQAAINMLVAVALIPTKGLTLPFVSYGGSSMLVSCLALGILLNISRDQSLARFAELFPDAGRPTSSGRRRQARKRRRFGGAGALLARRREART